MVSVTDYLEQARECASLADRKTGEEKKRLLQIAEGWLKLVEDQAKLQVDNYGKLPGHPKTL